MNFRLNKKLKLNQTIVINLLSSVLLQGITFFVMPIFTRILGPEQYGYSAIYFTWVNIISNLIGLGLGSSIATGKYHMREEYMEYRNGMLILNAIVCLLAIMILTIFINPLCTFLSYEKHIFIILLFTCFSHSVVASFQSVFVYEKKALLNFVVTIFISVGTVILSLIFILNINFANMYYGRVYGHFIPYILISILLLLYVVINNKIIIKKRYFLYAFSYGFPIVFHVLAHNILGQSDRIMMEKLDIPISNIGIYSLFYSFTSVVHIILGSFNTSFTPFYYDDIDTKNIEGMHKKVINYTEIYTIICVGFMLLSREVSYILANKNFYAGIDMIPIFVMANYFIFLYLFPVNFEFYHKQTKTIALGTVLAAIVNILINFVSIKKWGMYGAALSTFVSYILLFVFHYVNVLRFKEDRYLLNLKFFMPFIIIMLVSSFSFHILKDFVAVRWIIGIMLGIYEAIKIYRRKTIF